jgi:ABC-2 type transport system ATP-binding protein
MPAAAVTAPLIVTEHLSRRFGPIKAVSDLDLTIPRGAVFGLVGPDGAGKTTTLRLLATILTPTAGRATVDGHDTVTDAQAIKPRVGYMAQEFRLYGDLSVQENLDFFADMCAVHGAVRRERMARLLHFARLTEFTRRRASQLSGGMKKKLALACSLIHQPDILLLDEPTTGVDPVARREFWDILSDLHLQGVTMVVSTPYMDEAERCSAIALLHAGRLVVSGTPAQIKALVTGEVIEVCPQAEGQAGQVMRRAQQLLGALPGVLEVQTYGNLLHLVVNDGASTLPAVAATLRGHGIEPNGLRITAARMEEAFIWLIRRQADG